MPSAVADVRRRSGRPRAAAWCGRPRGRRPRAIAISAASTPGRSSRSPVSAIGWPAARPSTMRSSSIAVVAGLDRRVDRQLGELELAAARRARWSSRNGNVRRLLGRASAVVVGQREAPARGAAMPKSAREASRASIDAVGAAAALRVLEDRPAVARSALCIGALEKRVQCRRRASPCESVQIVRERRRRAAGDVARVPAGSVSGRALVFVPTAGSPSCGALLPKKPTVCAEREGAGLGLRAARPASARGDRLHHGEPRSSAGCRSARGGRSRARPALPTVWPSVAAVERERRRA